MYRAGFTEFLNSGALSDVTLLVGKRRYKVHRLILAFSSDFFASLLSTEFREKSQSEIELGFPDPKNVFPEVLHFMYSGRLDITVGKVVAILAQAEQYLIKPLVARCREFIAKNINRNTVISLLLDGFAFHQDDLVEQCLLFLATNFLHMAETTQYSSLDPSLFYRLVSHDRLAVHDEWILYKTIDVFVNENRKIISPELASKMFGCVRYRWLSYKQLTEAVTNELVPRQVIIDALMARLHTLEAPKVKLRLSDSLKKREWKGAHFEVVVDDGIPKGIIHWLARNCGRSPWQNPATTGIINVFASSVERGKVTNVVDEQPREFWTSSIPASWVAIDLNRYKVIPTAYALRHGGNYRADTLRNWDVQGSVDGTTWHQLNKHYNDDSLNGPFDVKVFTVQKVDVAYRWFRLIQTGHNSSGRNFLAISGLELFGDVWGPSAPMGEDD